MKSRFEGASRLQPEHGGTLGGLSKLTRLEVRMKLMYALSQQLGAKNLDENAFQQKANGARKLGESELQVEWLQELWLTMELGD